MAITQTSGYDKWKYINTGTSAQNVRSGPGTGYSKLTSLSTSLVGNLYNVRDVETASNGIDWVEIEYSSGSWGWCAVESQDVSTGKWYYYWEFYSSGSSGYGGSAIEYYYWPTSPTAYSSTALYEYTFKPDNDSSTPLKSSTYGNEGNFVYNDKSNIIFSKSISGTVTNVQTGTKTVKKTYAHKGWATSKPTSITAASNVGLGGSFSFKVGDSSKKFYAVFNDPTSGTATYSNNTVTSITNPADYSANTTYTVSFSDEYNTHDDKTAVRTRAYTFDYWKNASGNQVTFPITFTSSMTITAVFKTKSTTYGTIALPKPTKTNYIFKGWKDSSGTIYSGGSTYTVKSTHTLTAVWSDKITVTLSNNKNWTGDYAPTGGGTYNINSTVTINQPLKAGYYFVKWTNSSGTTISTSASYQFKPSNDVTYTSYVEPNLYTVDFRSNGGSGTMSRQTHTYDSSKKLTKNAFTRNGYKFMGWSDSPDSKTVKYTDEQSVKNLTTTRGKNIVVYAIWEPSGTVRFNNKSNNLNTLAQTFIFKDNKWYHVQAWVFHDGSWQPAKE